MILSFFCAERVEGDNRGFKSVGETRGSSCQQAASRLSKGLEMGLLQSGKINDNFKNLRAFTTVENGKVD